MVVADQGNWLADVVFVIEGTANLSPYVESLKANYIIPTLEYFNGAPADDRDCGCDYNSTMYALVVFMAADCAPETAATCSTPTTNIHKFLSLFDKVMFIGGAGESHSHIAEGLSTALQAFDDFQALRENNVATQKHCILICNSPPYPIPALESSMYSLLMPEQLASVMAERQVNFSILSPRKIPTLFKLYEKAGGDLQLALTKNYAKDRRHLVLLRGYQLQERPMSPPSIENKAVSSSSNSVCSPPTQGTKRPATNSPPNPREMTGFKQPQTNYGGLDWPSSDTPTSQISVQSSMPGSGGPTQTLTYAQPGLSGQPNPRPGIPTPPGSHLAAMNQPNPPNVTITSKAQQSQLPGQHMDNVRPPRGQSPITVGAPRMQWSQTAVPSPPASTPPTTSVLATQLSIAPSTIRHPNPQLSQPATMQMSQSQTTIMQSQLLNQQAGSLRPNLQNVGVRMTTASPGSVPSVSSTSNNLAVQLGQHPSFAPQNSQSSQLQQSSQLPSQIMQPNMQSKLGSGSSMNPMVSSQVPPTSMTSAPSSNMPPQTIQSNMSSLPMNNLSGQPSSTQLAASLQGVKDRRNIWGGIIEFQEKTPNAPQQGQRVSHTLTCTFSCNVNNGEPEVNADKWPNKLVLQLLPKQLVMSANLFSVLKTASRHVLIHFNQESEALQKLCKIMSSNWVGCIQFSSPCDIRIMLIVYMADKRIYMGFIANDQDSFFNAIRQMYESHRKQMQQQQQKQRLQQLSANPNPTSEGMGLPSSTASNPGIIMSQTQNISGSNPMGSRMALGQQQVTQNVQQLPQQAPTSNTGGVHSTTMNQQPQATLNQQQTARLSQLEAARQQNLLKIQHLQQTLEAAQQKEQQFKIAQEQQQQQQQQQHVQQQQQQVVIRQIQQQLQHQQQQLQQQQQRIQMQQVQQVQQVSQGAHNPQLRNLLQQQVQQQIRQQQQQQQHQMLMQQQQHPQNIRAQLSSSMSSGGISSSVGQPQQSQQQSQQSQQSWGDAGILDMLPP